MTPATPTLETPTPSTLSARLRDETRDAHRAAERGRLVRDLLRGDLTRDRYADFLAALHRLYTALERGLEAHRDHPCVAPLHWPALARAPAIARDLAALVGADAEARIARDTAADACVARLTALAAADPPLLLAHAYVNYLGDLSGGQILRSCVARFAPDALARFDFPGLDVAAARHEFRARLDAAPLAPRPAAAVVAEARRAFALHAALADALA